ncbi:hypothetical protein Ae201684P_015742 [Aphanomyces euteiches]|nr:hypothetical protein Ae201684P_015742 [Aphanomyces euteiches]
MGCTQPRQETSTDEGILHAQQRPDQAVQRSSEAKPDTTRLDIILRLGAICTLVTTTAIHNANSRTVATHGTTQPDEYCSATEPADISAQPEWKAKLLLFFQAMLRREGLSKPPNIFHTHQTSYLSVRTARVLQELQKGKGSAHRINGDQHRSSTKRTFRFIIEHRLSGKEGELKKAAINERCFTSSTCTQSSL